MNTLSPQNAELLHTVIHPPSDTHVARPSAGVAPRLALRVGLWLILWSSRARSASPQHRKERATRLAAAHERYRAAQDEYLKLVPWH